jgi:hypothetical protein
MNNQQDIQREEVHSIVKNGFEIKVGDRLSCLCQYEILNLHPVWDSRTGKHLIDHPNNDYRQRLQVSNQCPLHSGMGGVP